MRLGATKRTCCPSRGWEKLLSSGHFSALAAVVAETEARCPVFNLVTDAGVETEMVWLKKPTDEA